MPSVDRGHGFPGFSVVPGVSVVPGFSVVLGLAVVLGGIGAVCLALGLLGRFSPGMISFAPVLMESTVSSALVLVGAIFIVFELALVLRWVQRRSVSSRST